MKNVFRNDINEYLQSPLTSCTTVTWPTFCCTLPPNICNICSRIASVIKLPGLIRLTNAKPIVTAITVVSMYTANGRSPSRKAVLHLSDQKLL